MLPALLFQAVVRATVILAGAWVVARLWRTAPAVRRHALLAASAVVLLAVWLPGFTKVTIPAALAIPVAVPQPAAVGATAPAAPVPSAPTAPSSVPWPQALASLYLAGAAVAAARLAWGWLAARRTLRGAAVVQTSPHCVESDRTEVPYTVGLLRPVIVLPADWREWPEARLRAVLAHEEAHIERRDAATHWLAALQRAVFWFHPGAAWLQRHLADAADEACDDIAIRKTGDPITYAETLLSFAARYSEAAPAGAMPMARSTQVGPRIERALREMRPALKLTGTDVLRLCLVLVPLLIVSTAVQFAQPAQPAPPRATSDLPWAAQGSRMTDADAQALEERVRANEEDWDARNRLIAYYYAKANKDDRLRHLLWLTAHHPDAALFVSGVAEIRDVDEGLDDRVAYNSARNLWMSHIQAAAGNPEVLANAARFFSTGEPGRALELWQKARSLQPGNQIYTINYAMLGNRLLATAPASAAPFRMELDTSQDAVLLREAAKILTQAGASAELVELGRQLEARARALGAPAERQQPPAGAAVLTPLDAPLPVYPPLALQARISGQVQFRATVGRDGSVGNLQLIGGHPLLVPAAKEAARQYRYPAQAEPVETTITIRFAGQVYRIGGDVQSPVPIYKVEPEYPQDAKADKRIGTVIVSVVINTEGLTESANVVQGDSGMAAKALEAVRQWRFRPGTKDGQPVPVQAMIEVNFKLN
jgi:TonB family protein